MKLMPVRWNFIKSPKARKPYAKLKRIYQLELRNVQGAKLSRSEKEARATARRNTLRETKKRLRAEIIERIGITIAMIICAIVLVYFVMLK